MLGEGAKFSTDVYKYSPGAADISEQIEIRFHSKHSHISSKKMSFQYFLFQFLMCFCTKCTEYLSLRITLITFSIYFKGMSYEYSEQYQAEKGHLYQPTAQNET